jgi:hypothetical protein
MPAEAAWQTKAAVVILTPILVEDPLIVGGNLYEQSSATICNP